MYPSPHTHPQATPEELLKNLCEETVDDLFMKDFLLTYKTFLPSPLVVVDQLKKAWVEGMPEQRERVGWLGFFQGADSLRLSCSKPGVWYRVTSELFW